jgi:phosphatidylglycerol:prolipoprotein diacylglycerol transferase
MILIGFLLALRVSTAAARRQEASHPAVTHEIVGPEHIWRAAWPAVVFAMLGARLLYIMLNSPYFAAHPTDLVRIGDGGFCFLGAPIAGLAYLCGYCHLHKLSLLTFLDLCTPGFALAYAFGRIGCFLSGCCYGRACDLPWATRFLTNGRPGAWTAPCHPAQIYAAGFNLLWFVMLDHRNRRPHRNGEIVLGYLLLYCLYRSINDLFRGGVTADYWMAGITHAQALCLAAIPLLLALWRRLSLPGRDQENLMKMKEWIGTNIWTMIALLLLPLVAACGGNGPNYEFGSLVPGANRLIVNPTPVRIPAGSSGSVDIGIAVQDSFDVGIDTSYNSFPTGKIVMSFNPPESGSTDAQPYGILDNFGGAGKLKMTIQVDGTTHPGVYLIHLIATNPDTILSHRNSSPTGIVQLAVVASTAPTFSVSAAPATQTVTAPATATYTVTVASVNNFAGTVNLTAVAAPHLPTGGTAVFNPSSVTLTGGGSATSTLTLTTQANLGAAPETAALTITGTSGSATQTAAAALTVNYAQPGNAQFNVQ